MQSNILNLLESTGTMSLPGFEVTLTSQDFEKDARMYLRKNGLWLRAAHDNTLLPMYRQVCMKIAKEAAQDATKQFALARMYRVRGF